MGQSVFGVSSNDRIQYRIDDCMLFHDVQRRVGYTPVFITQFRPARPAIIHCGVLLYVCLPIQ